MAEYTKAQDRLLQLITDEESIEHKENCYYVGSNIPIDETPCDCYIIGIFNAGYEEGVNHVTDL